MNNNFDIATLKKLEVEMLKEFIAICSNHNFRYFLIGGSCLGAVRHKGFIPWDDDIDVGMPRKDYEKFLEIAQRELSENIFLQTAKTDPNYANNFAKLRNSNTTFIETSVKNFDINHGVFIDIFPLDGYNDSPKVKRKERNYMRGIQFSFYVKKESVLFNLARSSVKLIVQNYKKLRDKREKLLKLVDYDCADTVANYCGAWGEKETMPKRVFGQGIECEFEGVKVIIPQDYDEYLTRLYGEYTQFPPLEKRVSHHYCEVIDLSQSYKIYKQKEKNSEKSYNIRNF